jgi:ABC-type transporter lipoprotein component MlaA
VNHTLQGRLDRTAKETGRFLVNTTAGVGGIMKPADKIPALADIPKVDTGQTFGKWGVPHGPYLVFPVLGPTSSRDLVGTAGDTVLNPVAWLGLLFGGAAWTTAVSAPSGAHGVPDQMDRYDMATKDALDPYISARTGYMQNREAAVGHHRGRRAFYPPAIRLRRKRGAVGICARGFRAILPSQSGQAPRGRSTPSRVSTATAGARVLGS